MNKKNSFFVLILFVFSFTLFAQNGQENESEENAEYNYFLLIPILETAFSGIFEWRADYPLYLPPDGFFASGTTEPSLIELSNGDTVFTLRRNKEGRLVNFPLFLSGEAANVQAVYDNQGALKNMTITFINEDYDSEIWNIEFPSDFLPYSILSPGGSFAPVKITCGDNVFFVFIFETPSFLTETWYNEDGNMLFFAKALTSHNDGRWRVRSLQIHDYRGQFFRDYFSDPFGNFTEIRTPLETFSALFRGNRPIYWKHPLGEYELQWDTRGILTVKKSNQIEYRYEYEFDTAGNWVSRTEKALVGIDALLVPSPSFSRGNWTRRIEY